MRNPVKQIKYHVKPQVIEHSLFLFQFSCSNVSSCQSSGRVIANWGNNRFCCFLCDYDLCRNCINWMAINRRQQQQQQQQQQQPTLDISAANSNSSNQLGPESPPPTYDAAVNMVA